MFSGCFKIFLTQAGGFTDVDHTAGALTASALPTVQRHCFGGTIMIHTAPVLRMDDV